jgi:hypothetical protein
MDTLIATICTAVILSSLVHLESVVAVHGTVLNPIGHVEHMLHCLLDVAVAFENLQHNVRPTVAIAFTPCQ